SEGVPVTRYATRSTLRAIRRSMPTASVGLIFLEVSAWLGPRRCEGDGGSPGYGNRAGRRLMAEHTYAGLEGHRTNRLERAQPSSESSFSERLLRRQTAQQTSCVIPAPKAAAYLKAT